MKRVLFLLALILSITNVMAQELTVKNFALDPTDLTASTQRRNDNNGQACALIKVQLARPGAEFLGNVMGDTPYSKSEYFVYMMKGSKMLQVKLDGYLPIRVNFTDYGISGVESLSTYVLSITLPNVVGQMEDDGKTYFCISVTPKNASLRVDGELVALDDGQWLDKLDRGVHSYKIEAAGYESKEKTFTLGTERMNVEEVLVSTMATLTVKCPTAGADIYINEKKYSSNSTWTGTLVPRSYVIEARKEGYYTQQQSVELAAKQSRTVELPALIARVGQLDVAYKPLNSEVWIDGNKVGKSPDVFKNLIVGSHRVEIRKEGYQSETKTVTIVEGQTASLSGSLMANSKETFTVNGVSFTMVRVEGGTFTMGATEDQGSEVLDREKPAHQVTLSTYSIGETEVTQELWEAIMGSNPSKFKGTKLPVEQVSWNDCQEFIKKLNDKTGKTFRLPTEAEWEFAARGGIKSKHFRFSGSNNIGEIAWYGVNSGDKELNEEDFGKKEKTGELLGNNHNKPHPVAQKAPNELGLYDMTGNVDEMCNDWIGPFSQEPQTDPQGPSSGSSYVSRGGAWGDSMKILHISYRSSVGPDSKYLFQGFRLAL